MNIFILDSNPKLAAQYHNDKHVVKMITESAQMLSTAVRTTGLEEGYKISHLNHPCTKWARESIDNWIWLADLALYLHEEWRYRYDHPKSKTHKAYEVIENLTIPDLPENGLTPFALAMPEQYKSKDVVESYRIYYKEDKASFSTWKKRGPPPWWNK